MPTRQYLILYTIADNCPNRYVPFMVIRQGFRSTSIAVGFTIVAIIMAIFVLNAVQETSSRLAWSFARDNGLLFSSTLAQIHPKLQVPVYALFLTYGILVVCGCVFVASTTGTYDITFVQPTIKFGGHATKVSRCGDLCSALQIRQQTGLEHVR